MSFFDIVMTDSMTKKYSNINSYVDYVDFKKEMILIEKSYVG